MNSDTQSAKACAYARARATGHSGETRTRTCQSPQNGSRGAPGRDAHGLEPNTGRTEALGGRQLRGFSRNAPP
eukprot:10047546-Lingulodinium_polyedra.AAC.1